MTATVRSVPRRVRLVAAFAFALAAVQLAVTTSFAAAATHARPADKSKPPKVSISSLSIQKVTDKASPILFMQ